MSEAYSVGHVDVTNETDSALLVEGDAFDEPTWIPKSQIHDSSEVRYDGDTGELVVTAWLARQRGWL